MSGAITIVVEDVSTLRVTLGGAADTAIDPTAWMVGVASGLGASPSVTEVEVDGDDYLLTVYPSLTPAATYQVTGPIKTAYYSSPGGAGDYLEASTALAAREIFPGPTYLPSWSIGYWFEPAAFTSGQRMLTVSAIDYDNDGEALIVGLGDDYGGFVALYNTDSDEFSASLSEGPGAPIRLGVVSNGVVIKFYENGALVGTSSAIGGTFAERDALRFFNDQLGTKPAAGTVRNIVVNDRAHTALEEADLYAAGPTHHPLRATGTHWAAGQSIPLIWYEPAVAGVVANSGDGGACDLTFNGDIESITDGTSTVSDTIAIPSDLVEAFVSIPLTGRLPVRQLLAIIGRQHQRIAGTGATIMREPWTPGDTRLLVKSTLKLPSAGAVFAGNLRFTYTSKTSGSLEGVTPQHETQEPISIGAFVTFDESSRVPQDLAL